MRVQCGVHEAATFAWRGVMWQTTITTHCAWKSGHEVTRGREGGREGKGGRERDLDLHLGADLKAHKTPGVTHDGAPNNTTYRPAMPCEMHTLGPRRTLPGGRGRGTDGGREGKGGREGVGPGCLGPRPASNPRLLLPKGGLWTGRGPTSCSCICVPDPSPTALQTCHGCIGSGRALLADILGLGARGVPHQPSHPECQWAKADVLSAITAVRGPVLREGQFSVGLDNPPSALQAPPTYTSRMHRSATGIAVPYATAILRWFIWASAGMPDLAVIDVEGGQTLAPHFVYIQDAELGIQKSSLKFCGPPPPLRTAQLTPQVLGSQTNVIYVPSPNSRMGFSLACAGRRGRMRRWTVACASYIVHKRAEAGQFGLCHQHESVPHRKLPCLFVSRVAGRLTAH